MAKRKRKSTELWAARQGDDISIFLGKPKLKGSKCGECGQKVYWEGPQELDICDSGWEEMTGIKIGVAEAVQIKVTRVEE